MRYIASLVVLLLLVASLLAQDVRRRPIIAASCAFPCNGILDNFNRANEGPPPSASWTSSIFSADSGLKVISNQLASGASGPSSAHWNTSFGPNCEVYIVLKDVSGERPGVLARVGSVGTPNGYYLFVANSTTLRLFRVDSGSNTQLGADFTQSMAANDSIGMSLIGSTITIYYKASAGSWTSLGTRSDGTYSGAGFIGVRSIDGTNSVFADDFGGGSL